MENVEGVDPRGQDWLGKELGDYGREMEQGEKERRKIV